MIRTLLNICTPRGVLALLLLALFTPSAAAQARRHVLFLYGSEKDLPMNLLIDR